MFDKLQNFHFIQMLTLPFLNLSIKTMGKLSVFFAQECRTPSITRNIIHESLDCTLSDTESHSGFEIFSRLAFNCCFSSSTWASRDSSSASGNSSNRFCMTLLS